LAQDTKSRNEESIFAGIDTTTSTHTIEIDKREIGERETLTLFVGKQSHFVETHTLYCTHNTVTRNRREIRQPSLKGSRELKKNVVSLVSQRPKNDERTRLGDSVFQTILRKIPSWESTSKQQETIILSLAS
jgi:hypothetical protein